MSRADFAVTQHIVAAHIASCGSSLPTKNAGTPPGVPLYPCSPAGSSQKLLSEPAVLLPQPQKQNPQSTHQQSEVVQGARAAGVNSIEYARYTQPPVAPPVPAVAAPTEPQRHPRLQRIGRRVDDTCLRTAESLLQRLGRLCAETTIRPDAHAKGQLDLGRIPAQQPGYGGPEIGTPSSPIPLGEVSQVQPEYSGGGLRMAGADRTPRGEGDCAVGSYRSEGTNAPDEDGVQQLEQPEALPMASWQPVAKSAPSLSLQAQPKLCKQRAQQGPRGGQLDSKKQSKPLLQPLPLQPPPLQSPPLLPQQPPAQSESSRLWEGFGQSEGNATPARSRSLQSHEDDMRLAEQGCVQGVVDLRATGLQRSPGAASHSSHLSRTSEQAACLPRQSVPPVDAFMGTRGEKRALDMIVETIADPRPQSAAGNERDATPVHEVSRVIPGTIRRREPCRFFLEGRCKEGDACGFLHEGSPRRRSDVCKFFIAGNCHKDKDCLFSHDLKSAPCRRLHLDGRCRDGASCRFSHAELSRAEMDAFKAALLSRQSSRATSLERPPSSAAIALPAESQSRQPQLTLLTVPGDELHSVIADHSVCSEQDSSVEGAAEGPAGVFSTPPYATECSWMPSSFPTAIPPRDAYPNLGWAPSAFPSAQ